MVPPEFTVLWSGARYRRREVDAFVDRLLESVHRHAAGVAFGRGRTLTRTDVLGVRFSPMLLGRGYAANEVDQFVDQSAEWLPVASPGRRSGPRDTLPHGLRPGYDVREVDEFVQNVMNTLENRPGGPPVRLRDIRRVRFTLTQVREGYDAADVQMFLEEAEAWLGEAEAWLGSVDRARRSALRPGRPNRRPSGTRPPD